MTNEAICIGCGKRFQPTKKNQFICQACFSEVIAIEEIAKHASIFIMLLISLQNALSWTDYVKLPIEEKMLLQYERLNQISNGEIFIEGMSKTEAVACLKYYSNYEYSQQAVSHIQGILKNITPVQNYSIEETKFIKVGDSFVSEKICNENQKLCEAPAINKTQEKVIVNKRTAAECVEAREKDWEIYCWQNYPNIACDGVNEVDKNMVLDNLAQGYYSNQAICLRGE